MEAHAADYRGFVSVTRSNITCQKWTSQSPHRHSFSPGNYSDSGLGDHNFCRNPGGRRDFAWCYTTEEETQWDYCNIGPANETCEELPEEITEIVTAVEIFTDGLVATEGKMKGTLIEYLKLLTTLNSYLMLSIYVRTKVWLIFSFVSKPHRVPFLLLIHYLCLSFSNKGVLVQILS